MHVDLLRSPLREEARSLVAIALKNGKRRSGVRHLLAEGDTDRLRLDVYPMLASEISEKAAVIVFTPLRAEEPTVLTDRKNGASATAQSERKSTLENEVATTREVLQQTIEELETSNEELQSLNEELITVNEELEMTTSELTERSAELEPVLRSAPLVILVTDTALQITQATQEAINLFGLSSPTTGPHISQSVLPHGFPALSHLCSESMRQGEKTVRDFDSNGEHVSLICSPYFNSHGKVSGVTLVVTRFPGLAIEMDTVLKTEGICVMHRTKGGKAMRISKPFDTFLQSTPKALVGERLRDCIDEDEADEISSDDRES
ncbi:PAS domain-containing protein [Sulfitobacter sp. JB4-11]|uniref:PAS domain-containing protein n=1 Tax=Sulfitobacter rhodophyticola TaxID=3238304 RepID=UPI003510E09A